MQLTKSDFQRIQRWMARNARPLDYARWQFHFENGSQEDVLRVLSAYQNEDGGFGNAIEPDSWNPNSSPYATYTALLILEEIKFRDRKHVMIQKILHYLESGPEFNGETWPALVSTNELFPHAPWWSDPSYDWGFTPTAFLAGFILYAASENDPFYPKAAKIAETAIHRYLFGKMPNGEAYRSVRREGEISGIQQLLDFIEEKGLRQGADLGEIKNALREQATVFIEKDPTRWNQYCWKPSNFVRSPDSLFYPGNEEAVEAELDFILNQRNPEGIWDIIWTWGAYEKEFAISENWWKASVILSNCLLLRSFGRLEA